MRTSLAYFLLILTSTYTHTYTSTHTPAEGESVASGGDGDAPSALRAAQQGARGAAEHDLASRLVEGAFFQGGVWQVRT